MQLDWILGESWEKQEHDTPRQAPHRADCSRLVSRCSWVSTGARAATWLVRASRLRSYSARPSRVLASAAVSAAAWHLSACPNSF